MSWCGWCWPDVSREGVELIRELFVLLAVPATSLEGRKQGLDLVFDVYLHPDVEYREDPRWPGSDSYRGIDAVRARFHDYLEAMQVSLELDDVIDAGDRVVALYRAIGTGAGSGSPYEQAWAWVIELKDGRIADFQAYLDREAALAAAGLGPL